MLVFLSYVGSPVGPRLLIDEFLLKNRKMNHNNDMEDFKREFKTKKNNNNRKDHEKAKQKETKDQQKYQNNNRK